MRVFSDISMAEFKPWSGAVDTYKRVENAGRLDDLECIIEELYPDGVDETTLNDLLWFDDDMVYEWLGMRTEHQIREELRDKQDELDDLESDLAYDLEEVEEQFDDPDEVKSAKEELYARDYKADIDSLKEEIAALEEELESL